MSSKIGDELGLGEPAPDAPQHGPGRPQRGGLEIVLAAVLYAGLTVLFVAPDPRVLDDHIASDRGDPLLNLVFMMWGEKKLGESLDGFWDANFFYPVRGVTAMSDHLLGPAAVLAALHRGLGIDQLLAYNLIFLGAFFGCALATFLVARWSGTPYLAALFAGTWFAWNPYRLDQVSHIQVLLALWIPLLLWLFLRLLRQPTLGRAAVFVALYTLHVLGGSYLAYHIHWSFALVAACAWASGGLPPRRHWQVLLPVAAICAAIATAVFLPYLERSAALGLERSTDEIRHYGGALSSYLSKNIDRAPHVVFGLRTFRGENALFPGWAALLLGVWGMTRTLRWSGWRARDRPAISVIFGAGLALIVAALLLGDALTLRRDEAAVSWVLDFLSRSYERPFSLIILGLVTATAASKLAGGAWSPLRFRTTASEWQRSLFAVGVVALLLSLPVVYVPLAEIVPGLDAMRVTTRVYPLFSLGLCLFAAEGLAALDKRLPVAGRGLLYGALAAMVLWEGRSELPWKPLPRESEFPDVYAWIADHDEVEVIAHYPPALGPDDIQVMYFSTRHWKPIVNGHSGHEPPGYRQLIGTDTLPTKETIDGLRAIGVTHLVVDFEGRSIHRTRRRIARFQRQAAEWEGHLSELGLEPVAFVEPHRVYRIVPTAANGQGAQRRARQPPTAEALFRRRRRASVGADRGSDAVAQSLRFG